MKIRTYEELVEITSFEDRFEYLMLKGAVGSPTFGYDRYLNQVFYKTSAWKRARDLVMIRDNGCDLGVVGYDISGKILVHHMNPMTPDSLKKSSLDVIDPRFLICTSELTHQAIHYGDRSLLPQQPIIRLPGDTKLW